jgi:DNA-binding LytR/AlgR family response regulator
VYGDFKNKILSSKHLGYFEGQLQRCGFVRIHHSHLVSIYQIVRLDKTEFLVELKNGDILPISRDRKRNLVERIRELTREE